MEDENEEVKTCLALLDSMLSEFDTSLPSSPTAKSAVPTPLLPLQVDQANSSNIEKSTFILKISKNELEKSEALDENGNDKPLDDSTEFPVIGIQVDDTDNQKKAPPAVPTRSPTTRLSVSSNDCPSPVPSTSSTSSWSYESTPSPNPNVPSTSEASNLVQPEVVCVNGVAYVPVNYSEAPKGGPLATVDTESDPCKDSNQSPLFSDVDGEVFTFVSAGAESSLKDSVSENSEKRSSPTIITVVQESNGTIDMNVISSDKTGTSEHKSKSSTSNDEKFKTVKMLIKLGKLEGLDEPPPSFKPPPPPSRKKSQTGSSSSPAESKQHSNHVVVTVKHEASASAAKQSSPVLLRKTDPSTSSRCSPAAQNAADKNVLPDSSSSSAHIGRDNKALSTFGSKVCERGYNVAEVSDLHPVQVKLTGTNDSESIPRFNIYGEMSSSSTEDVLSDHLSEGQHKQSSEAGKSHTPSPGVKEKTKKKKEAKKMPKKKKNKAEDEHPDKAYKIPEPLVEELEAKIKTRLDASSEEKELGKEQRNLKEASPSKEDGGIKERKHRWKSLWRKKTPEKDDT